MYGVCGYALVRGRPEARIVALVFLVGDLATLALRSRFAAGYLGLETNVLIVDALAFLAFTYAALISDRFWPLWIAGLQLTSSMGHLFKAVDAHLLPIAYAAALRMWAWPILIILGIGTWRARRRTGPDTASPA